MAASRCASSGLPYCGRRPTAERRRPVPEVMIVEVSPRDGLPNEPVVLPPEAKVERSGRLVRGGARRTEALSFAHPNLVPAMADAEAVMAAVPRADGVSYAGLVLNRRGLDRAVAAGVGGVNV